MLHIVFISILLAAANAEGEATSNFRGEWVVPMTYPAEEVTATSCRWYNITTLDPLKCSCGKLGNIPVYNNGDAAFPVIFINETEDVTPFFKSNCFCNGVASQHLILRTLDLTSYVVYFKPKYLGDKAPLYISLLLKEMPKLSKIYKMWNSVPDLRDKEGTLLCPRDSFLKEDS